MSVEEGGDNSLYSVAVLIDELKHEDMQLRLNSMNKLPTIAKALGPERTRNELLPFLSESIDDEDEVLLVVAAQLGSFDQYLGGSEHISVLLPPLESLATVEEPTVREKAVDSMCKLAQKMSEPSLSKNFVGMLRRLAQRDWFTARLSSCFLFTVAYPRVSTANKAEFRGMFGQLCRDDTPMVRRAAAKNLATFAQAVEPDFVLSELLPLFALLSEEDQDSVRLLAVNNAVALAGLLDEDANKAKVLPVVLALVADKSWRVRWSVADRFCDVCQALGEDMTSNDLAPAFVKLLSDAEAEVRTAAASRVTDVAKCLPDDSILGLLLAPVEKLTKDSSDHVRSALALVIMGLAPLVGKKSTTDSLLPLYLLLLKDDNAEVRLNLISTLGALNQVIGIDLLSQSLMPAIVKLAEDNTWRIRLAIIEHVPLLAEQLGVKVFEDSLSELCLSWLSDKIFAVRSAAANNLKKLTESFGEDWAKKNIVPRIVQLNNNPSYLCRMIVLRSVEVLASSSKPDIVNGKLMDLVFAMAKDPVPNVRFNVAKCLQDIADHFDPPTLEKAKAVLDDLAEDADADVKFFARRSIESIETMLD